MASTPEEILMSTTPLVRDLIEKVLKIEQDYEHIQNIDKVSSAEKDIKQRIIILDGNILGGQDIAVPTCLRVREKDKSYDKEINFRGNYFIGSR